MKKKLIIISSIIVVAVLGVCAFLYFGKGADLFNNEDKIAKEKQEVAKALEDYMAHISKQEYDQMYETLETVCKASNAQTTFVERNQKIYEGIEATNIKVTLTDTIKDEEDDDTYTVNYTTSMTTKAGDISFANSAKYVKVQEDGSDDYYWGLKWDHNIIYPELTSEYKVSVKDVEPVRGSILDRDGNKLSYTDENGTRVYAQGQICCHLIGYTGKVTADDLKDLDPEIYDANSIKGKKGLEYAFEDRLRGTKGCTIAIVDAQGAVIKKLAEIAVKNGEDIKTTIDMKVQKAIYNQLKDDMAASICLNPTTGEVLAMVSTPTYDPTTGSSSYSDSMTPYFNRFAATYCPGSSFKPLNAGIGLTTGAFTKDTVYDHSDMTWTKDGWGDYYIKTTHNYSGTKNLENAMIESDNIYFGRSALDIGRTKLMENLDKIGFGEVIPFAMTFKASTYTSSDDKTTALSSDAAMADTGFGQGQLLVNPLHMASVYTAFLNKGSMVQPYIEYVDSPKVAYYKENVFSEDAASTIKEYLREVVTEGTATDASSADVKLAGKTGTAELKASKDSTGKENGWFDGFTYDSKEPKLFITMVEDVADRGGSAYVVKKTKNIVNAIY